MSKAGPLGEYLRARRELIAPGDVGLPAHGRRRVPGLRREELALLAGISADYYLRLEQGRDRHPSAQVLDALARALRLDAEAAAHLHRLARPAPARWPARRPERVPVGIRQLVGSWTDTPAFVHGRYLDVLFANPVATELAPIYAVGVNLLRAVFLVPGVPALYPASEAVAANAVAGLRSLVGAEVDEPRLTELVEELSTGSERFRRLWARHDVTARAGGGIRMFRHPRVGELELRYEKLTIAGTNQSLVVYHAEPGSTSARSLRALARLAGRARPISPATPGGQL
ncbi:helix-turn-helix domain-containing protein [Micromonospora sp. GCM10011542]|uniref:helix-turn-helix domain-containing protein n=1 Tax=Micromonospora sp. GCM10011542 TaxID=3317337 RepID=UPI00361DAB72